MGKVITTKTTKGFHLKMKKTVFSAFMVAASVTTSLSFAATVATVNGVAVDDAIIQRNLAQVPEKLLEGRKEELTKQLIEKLVEQEIINQEATKLKIKESAEYKEQIKLLGDTLVTNMLLQKVVSDLVTEETVKAAYESTKEAYTAPGVKARHILVKDENEAKKLIRRLDKGAKFAELAEKESIGPSAKNGGDLGWFKANDMVKEFSDAAFTLAKGAYTKTPIKTKFGWHVILVEDKKDKLAPDFDQVRGQIEKQLQEKVVADYLGQLKADAKVVYK